MSIQISKARLIFKVVIIGRDLALQTGFLTQVSGRNISTQLFNTLGVSLGIARYDEDEEYSVTLQLWTIPQNERHAGLTQNFTKGHRAVIVIIRPDEMQELPNLFSNLSLSFDSNVVIGIVGSLLEASQACKDLNRCYHEDYQLLQASDTSDVINLLSHKLLDKKRTATEFPTFLVLDESICPSYVHPIQRGSETECTDEEINAIRNILLEQGLRLSGDTCIINIREGEASVSLRTGSVQLEPEMCKFCIHECKRHANVCIIAVDSGWSSQGISQKALLIAAKVIALAERNLPQHVETQIQRVNLCTKFKINPELANDGIHADLFVSHSKQSLARRSLLEAAEKRVKDGKLPLGAFNILKRRLLRAEKSISD